MTCQYPDDCKMTTVTHRTSKVECIVTDQCEICGITQTRRESIDEPTPEPILNGSSNASAKVSATPAPDLDSDGDAAAELSVDNLIEPPTDDV